VNWWRIPRSKLTPATAAKHATLADLLPAGTRVYVAFVPGENHRAVAAMAARVRAEGLVPVPHFPARSSLNRAQLDDYLRRVGGEGRGRRGAPDRRRHRSAPPRLLRDRSRSGCSRRAASAPIGFAGHHPEGQRALAAPAAAMTLEEKLA
jgi:methylenetetrahydrofolate reductase (NADPH)